MILVVVSMLMVTIMPIAVFAASNTDTWDGTADTDRYYANTTATAYFITTA